jgi:hypothetical protein
VITAIRVPRSNPLGKRETYPYPCMICQSCTAGSTQGSEQAGSQDDLCKPGTCQQVRCSTLPQLMSKQTKEQALTLTIRPGSAASYANQFPGPDR